MGKMTWLYFTRQTVLLLSGLLLIQCEAKSLSGQQNLKTQCINVQAASFMELADTSHAFVDKTLFIKDFLGTKFVPHIRSDRCWAPNSTKIMRVSYPRKWGKTMNMKMLEDFLQMEVDESGNRISPKETAAYRLFALGKTASGHDVRLKIASHRHIIDEHLAQHPVIYVSFKNVAGSNFDEIYTGVRRALAETFRKHAYMTTVFQNALNNKSASDEVKQKARENLGKFQAILSLTSDDWETLNGLRFLSEVLREHFDKKVYILLDDYDQPFLSLVTRKAPNSNELTHTRDFLLRFFDYCQDRWHYKKHYKKLLMSGVVRVPYIDSYPRVQALKHCAEVSVLGTKFSNHYGFNQDEVGGLFEKCGIDPKLAGEAKKRYKGYTIAGAPGNDAYNAYDISQFAYHGKISDYWVKSGSVPLAPFIFRNKMVESFVLTLLNKDTAVIEADDLGCSIKQLEELATAFNPPVSTLSSPLLTGYKANIYYEYLLTTGYLTLNKSTESLVLAHLRIPNEEITSEMVGLMIQHYKDTYSITADVQGRLEEALKRLPKVKDTVTFKKSLETFFASFPEFIDKLGSNGLKENEDVIKSAFNILILISKALYNLNGEMYLLKSDGDSSNSEIRPNILLTIEEMKLGIIIQLTFNVSSEKALAHTEKHVNAFDRHKYIKDARLIGVNLFPNKTVEINDLWKKINK